MKHLHISSLTLFSLLLLLEWTLNSDARPFRVGKLPGGGPNFGCAACHVNPGGGGELNAFGLDYEAIALAAGDVYTNELGQKDSDGDGFSNDEELNADPATEPWNRDSHPPEVPDAVEPFGKMFAIWARLKLEPIGLGGHLRRTSSNTVRESSTASKRLFHPVRQTNSGIVESDRSTAKNQRQVDSKPSVTNNKTNLKSKRDFTREIR